MVSRDGITEQDVINIRQAFDNLRDENDRPNEVKLSKLRTFPFFNKSDLSRFPKESERIVNQMKDTDYRYEMRSDDGFSGRNVNNQYDEGSETQQFRHNNNLNFSSNNSKNKQNNLAFLDSVKLENKSIDCRSVMCGCNNPKQSTFQLKGIRERSVTFDEFFALMSEKMKDSRQIQHTNIIFENKESNVSCFLWPLFGTQ